MGETNEATPIKRVEAIHMTGRQLDTLLQLCDGIPAPNRAKARVYNKAFVWASSHGEWKQWDEWRDEKLKRNVVPDHLLTEDFIVDADKLQNRAVVQLIDDAMKKGGLLLPSIRLLDKIYHQLTGESLLED